MGTWINRLKGGEAALSVVPPHEAPTTAADHRHPEKIRLILRLEFECAAECFLKEGNLTAARSLWNLAKTTQNVEVRVLYAYAQLLDDIASPPVSSDPLRQIGSSWSPGTVAEYVEKLVSVRRADRLTAQNPDK